MVLIWRTFSNILSINSKQAASGASCLLIQSGVSRHFHGKRFITIIGNGAKEVFLRTCSKRIWKIQKDKLDTEKLNLDGTHSLVKKSAQSAAYRHRKRGRTSNIPVMTDGKGIPIAIGGIISGNHNDLFQIVPQYAQMIKDLKKRGICVDNSIQNADKGFDSKKLRRAIHGRKMNANIVENKRNRKGKKRGRKRFFDQDIYDQRFVNERAFAWLDSFRTLLIRFDTLDVSWLNWHYLAFALILLKV